MNFLDKLKRDAEKAIEKYQDSLDFIAIAKVKNKPIEELSAADFEVLNMKLHDYYGYKELYRCKDYTGDEIFFNRLDDGSFEMLNRYMKMVTDIKTTTDLIDQGLTKFQLKKFD